jgi:hypothetical protein
MILSVEFFIYLVAGIVILVLYNKRRKGLNALNPESVPEMEKATFLELTRLLETSYQRTLYLGVSVLFLAYATARSSDIKAFCILLTLGLFIYNIPPRNKVMRVLDSSGIDLKSFKERGIRF